MAPNPPKIPPNVRKSPAEAARPKGGPEREVWNPRFQRLFGYFLFAQKVTAGRPGPRRPRGIEKKQAEAARRAADKTTAIRT